jgi:hypothetical protein
MSPITPNAVDNTAWSCDVLQRQQMDEDDSLSAWHDTWEQLCTGQVSYQGSSWALVPWRLSVHSGGSILRSSCGGMPILQHHSKDGGVSSLRGRGA